VYSAFLEGPTASRICYFSEGDLKVSAKKRVRVRRFVSSRKTLRTNFTITFVSLESNINNDKSKSENVKVKKVKVVPVLN
jgi:hypothetical protein